MILTRMRRIFGGPPRARMPWACDPRDLHVSFRDGENSLRCTLSEPQGRQITGRLRARLTGCCRIPHACACGTDLGTSGGRDEPEPRRFQSQQLELLSWGFPKMPLHRDPDRASTPGWLPTLRLGDANSELVPSLPFLPASTVCSARPPQVCCTLHPIMGFGPFRVFRTELALRRPQPRRPSPEPRFTPFRSLSLFRSRTSSPRPLPPRRSTMPRTEVRGAVPTSRP
jgi:hypothetical protein